jgi:hypothetical protein
VQGAAASLRISLFVEIPQLICCGVSMIMAGPPSRAGGRHGQRQASVGYGTRAFWDHGDATRPNQ